MPGTNKIHAQTLTLDVRDNSFSAFITLLTTYRGGRYA